MLHGKQVLQKGFGVTRREGAEGEEFLNVSPISTLDTQLRHCLTSLIFKMDRSPPLPLTGLF